MATVVLFPTLVNVHLTQFGVKKRLHPFEELGDAAEKCKMLEPHELGVMDSVPSTLGRRDRSDALLYLFFLKKKRDGSIEGRGCADGRKQRVHT